MTLSSRTADASGSTNSAKTQAHGCQVLVKVPNRLSCAGSVRSAKSFVAKGGARLLFAV
jgi:hypothetical protein